MMANGSNIFGVTFPQIAFISRLLSTHRNIGQVERTKDIQFDFVTHRGVKVRLICVNEYTCGLAKILEVLEEFPGANVIYVGGAWNGYTMQAKEYCIEAQIGLFNANEINGALYCDDYWTYSQKDDKGNPIYSTRAS